MCARFAYTTGYEPCSQRDYSRAEIIGKRRHRGPSTRQLCKELFLLGQWGSCEYTAPCFWIDPVGFKTICMTTVVGEVYWIRWEVDNSAGWLICHEYYHCPRASTNEHSCGPVRTMGRMVHVAVECASYRDDRVSYTVPTSTI